MNVPSVIFREYDVRGIVGEQLTPDFAHTLGRAFATAVHRRIGKAPKIVVGRDNRPSGDGLARGIREGIAAAGGGAIDIGQLPTPALYLAERQLGVDAGLQVTGSHNPPEFNGFKMVVGGEAFFGGDIQGLLGLIQRDELEVGKGTLTADHTVLDRYVRVRGGTLLLLPDRAPAGAASSLFPGIWTEHLTAVAEEVGPLKATEILRRSNTEVTDVVLGASSGMPAIVMSPAGNGRVLVSGAMDAWRHRGTNGNGFDRFFRGVLAELGQPRGELTIDMPASLVTAGSTVPFQVRSRRMQPAATETILATVLCGGGATGTVRVWPTGEPGGYAGEFPAATVGTCRLDVSVADGPSSSAGVAVVTAPRRDRAAALLSLERLAVATGGVAVVAGEEQQVGDRIRAQERPAAARTVVRPMQSPWWILPFAICLAGEWWLRRRDGLR